MMMKMMVMMMMVKMNIRIRPSFFGGPLCLHCMPNNQSNPSAVVELRGNATGYTMLRLGLHIWRLMSLQPASNEMASFDVFF